MVLYILVARIKTIYYDRGIKKTNFSKMILFILWSYALFNSSFLCVLFSIIFIYPCSFFLVQALNLILLTSSELSELRDLLKHSLVNPSGKDLFVSLYASWCHSPMAIISLCLLAQVRF